MSKKFETSLTESLLKSVTASSVNISTKISNIDELLTMSAGFAIVYDIVRSIVEMLLYDIRKEAIAYPEIMQQFVKMCRKHNFERKYTKHFEPKQIPYTDKQSVHIFMSDTRECIDWLIAKYEQRAFVRPFEHSFFNYAERSSCAIYRDKTMYDILALVMDYITKSKHRDELLNIMRSQLDESTDKCVSGQVTSLVSCLYGFPDVPEIKGNVFEHEKSATFNYLNKHLDLFDIDNIRTSIQALFRNGHLPITEATTRILAEYTHETWTVADLVAQDNAT